MVELTQFRDGNFTSGSTSYDKRVNSKVIGIKWRQGRSLYPIWIVLKRQLILLALTGLLTPKITPSQDGFISFEYDTQKKDDQLALASHLYLRALSNMEFVRTFAGTNVFFPYTITLNLERQTIRRLLNLLLAA